MEIVSNAGGRQVVLVLVQARSAGAEEKPGLGRLETKASQGEQRVALQGGEERRGVESEIL